MYIHPTLRPQSRVGTGEPAKRNAQREFIVNPAILVAGTVSLSHTPTHSIPLSLSPSLSLSLALSPPLSLSLSPFLSLFYSLSLSRLGRSPHIPHQ